MIRPPHFSKQGGEAARRVYSGTPTIAVCAVCWRLCSRMPFISAPQEAYIFWIDARPKADIQLLDVSAPRFKALSLQHPCRRGRKMT